MIECCALWQTNLAIYVCLAHCRKAGVLLKKQAMYQLLITDGCRHCISMGVICTWPDPRECSHGPSSAVFDHTSFPDTMLNGCQLNADTEI